MATAKRGVGTPSLAEDTVGDANHMDDEDDEDDDNPSDSKAVVVIDTILGKDVILGLRTTSVVLSSATCIRSSFGT